MTIALPILRSRPAGTPPRGVAGPPRAPEAAHGARVMADSYGRTIRDLRLSITDRCNFRCVYCLDPDVKFMPRGELLTVEEFVRVARVCVGLGVNKLRITGGEPTLHPRLTELIRALAALGVDDLAMTTNGWGMTDESLAAWREAGLTRVTLSLDSLRPERFAAMTRSRTPLEAVLESIRVAKRSGLEPVRVNAVIVRGFNEDELGDMAELAYELGIEYRFIEFMPLDSAHAWDRGRVVPASEMLERITEHLGRGGAGRGPGPLVSGRRPAPLVARGRQGRSGTALNFGFADGSPGGVGLIAPVTRPFCGACSRLRITADGKVRPCLFSRQEWDLRPLLRGEGRATDFGFAKSVLRADGTDRAEPRTVARVSDEQIAAFLRDATWAKQAGHGIGSEGFVQPERTMSAIGG